jgi:outer membrane protein OmpA-like peptidoglycan-associated protein
MKRILLLAIGQSLVISNYSMAASENSSDQVRNSWAISQLIETADGNTLAMIDVGTSSGLDAGMILESFRVPERQHEMSPIEQKVVVETGQLKIREVGPEFALAEILQQGSYLSKAIYPKFPGIMSGDRVFLKPLSITARKFVAPEAVASYFDLFADPKGMPTTFELSPSGMVQLQALVQPFLDKRATMIMVEGHTDHHGSSEANQVESYQRALTVRQYLIDRLGIDPKRVLAVGYGESELIDESMVDGFIEKNRRIVLKVAAE